jgi:hypothetical protein
VLVQQAVKDVVQTLVDDGLVTSDKIGTSNYFWSFPNQARQDAAQAIQEYEKQVVDLSARLVELDEKLNKATASRQPTDERTRLLTESKELDTENKRLVEELSRLASIDPRILKEKRTPIPVTHVGRTTDDQVCSRRKRLHGKHARCSALVRIQNGHGTCQILRSIRTR